MKKIIHIILILAIIISCLLSSVVISIDRHETSSGTTYGEIQSDTYNESNNLTLFRYPTGLDHVTELVQYPASGDKWDKINDTGTGDDDTTYVYTDEGGWQSAEWELSVPVQNNITINSVTIKAKCKINNILNVGSKLTCFFEYLGDSYSQYVNHTSYQYLNWTITQDDEGNPLEGSDFVDNIVTFTYSASASYHIRITQLYCVIDYIPGFNVTRTVGVSSESNTFSFTPSINYTGNVILKVPVSSDAQGIINVTNNTAGGLATEVNGTDELVNDTFWYDSANDFLHIRTINLTTSSSVNWTVLATYGMTFSLTLPTYLEVGDYFIATGLIKNATGVPVDGVLAKTRVLYSNGTDALETPPEWNCTNGNYYCVFSTSSLIPGVYSISIEFTDAGITYKEGGTLYLSFETPTGVYSNAVVFFSFYNTNIGLGLIPETFKVYINNVRNYINKYYGYTGEIINITIKDYYNFTMYSANYTIVQTYTGLNFGLTFHEYDFTNVNNEYFYASFLKENATRWYERVVSSSGGQKSFMLPSGNYSVRVYNADNSTYLSWNETINRSKAYLIGTDGVTLIIQGQSVIIGKFLEFSEDLDYYFMPDIEIICRNPPMIYSIYDKEGMAFGNDFYKICPTLITIATTRVTTYCNWINSTPMVPSNGSVINGTVTILRDALYLSGSSSITWVNITCADNNTLMQNTSYIPSRVDIYGQNLTINASGDISVMRETKYNQLRKFDWTYYPFEGYGPDPSRAGWHSAGIEFINPMSVPLYEVYGIAGFSNQSNSDGNSVVVRDTANGGVISKRGPDYDVTDAAIHFSLLSIDASSSRAFTIGYYKLSAESYTYSEGTVSIPDYDPIVWDSNSYNWFKAHWTNPYDTTFRGALYIKLNFNVPTEIDTTSMRIYDLTFDHELDPTVFIPGDKYIRISAEGMGDVLPGSGRAFDVYFLMTEYPGADPRELHLNTEIWMGITPFLIIFGIGAGFVILGACLAAWDKKEQKDRWKASVGLGVFIMVIFYILSAMGL